MLLEPFHRWVGVADQNLGQFRVGKAVGYPHHVVVVHVLGVLADFDGVLFGLGHVGDEGLDVVDAVKGEADDAAGEVGVAAAEVFGGLFHHQHRFALFLSGDGGAEGGIAGAHHDNVIFLSQVAPPMGKAELYGDIVRHAGRQNRQ